MVRNVGRDYVCKHCANPLKARARTSVFPRTRQHLSSDITRDENMFRLPTHLESLVPPPNRQVPHNRPWRGTLILPASSSSGSAQTLLCTAAETDGNNQFEIWPNHFYMQVLSQRQLLREMHDWVKAHNPPMCMIMTDRLTDPAAHRANETQFEAFASHLMHNQFVAIAPWNVPERILGAGIVLFPTGTSRNLLVGALFMNSNFPDFIHTLNLVPRSLPYSPVSGHSPYDPAPPNIATSQRHTQGAGSQSRYPA